MKLAGAAHLQGMSAQHPPRQTPALPVSFEKRMTDAGAWELEHGRNPRAGSPVREEASLGRFLAGFRSAFKGKGRTSWSPERQAFADRVAPQWQVNSEAQRDQINFRERMTAVGAWAQEHGRNPNANARGTAEGTLGEFLSGCRKAAKGKGTTSWSPERHAFADRVAPQWQVDTEAQRDQTNFRERMTAAGVWHQEHGRNPRTSSTDPVEAALGQFLTSCRSAFKGKGHASWSPERQAFADRVAPQWQVNSEAQRDQTNFRERITAIGAWEQAHGRNPRMASPDPAETILGRFHDGYRSAAKGNGSGLWTPERQTFADRVAPRWQVNSANERYEAAFRERMTAVGAWGQEHGRNPRMCVPDPTEAGLGRFLSNTRAAAKGKGSARWTPERQAFADQVAPSWRGGLNVSAAPERSTRDQQPNRLERHR